MGLINKAKHGGFMDQIRCDEPSYLIWKWHPAGSVPGRNSRENAIRWGSSLRVKDGEVAVSGNDIGAIEIDKSSEGYRQLMSVTKDLAGATAKVETEAKIKDIADKQRIEAMNYEELLHIQREEAQYAQHKQTQTANISAFQVEKQAEVGVAGAEALGQMGANGAGNVNLGSNGGGDGFNMAAMMASMAVGSAVGQNIAGTMNDMMGGVGQAAKPGTVPPPLPTATYHVAINGQAAGPFDLSALTQMAVVGQLTADSLVWKNGMVQWEKAGTMDDLKGLFTNAIPPVPPQ